MAKEHIDHVGLPGQPVHPEFTGEFPKPPAAVISGVAPWASRASRFAPWSSNRLAFGKRWERQRGNSAVRPCRGGTPRLKGTERITFEQLWRLWSGTTSVYAIVHSRVDNTVVPTRRVGRRTESHRAMDVRGTGQIPRTDTRRAIRAQYNYRSIRKRIAQPFDVEGRRSWHFADQPALSADRRHFVGHGPPLPVSKFCRAGSR